MNHSSLCAKVQQRVLYPDLQVVLRAVLLVRSMQQGLARWSLLAVPMQVVCLGLPLASRCDEKLESWVYLDTLAVPMLADALRCFLCRGSMAL
jgi:hypothetical protein